MVGLLDHRFETLTGVVLGVHLGVRTQVISSRHGHSFRLDRW